MISIRPSAAFWYRHAGVDQWSTLTLTYVVRSMRILGRFRGGGPFSTAYQGLGRPDKPRMPILVTVYSQLSVTLGPICQRGFQGMSRVAVCPHGPGSIGRIMESMISSWHLRCRSSLPSTVRTSEVPAESVPCNTGTTRDNTESQIIMAIFVHCMAGDLHRGTVSACSPLSPLRLVCRRLLRANDRWFSNNISFQNLQTHGPSCESLLSPDAAAPFSFPDPHTTTTTLR